MMPYGQWHLKQRNYTNTKLTPKRINRRSFLKTSAAVGVA
ncbi:MAG: twin-arginine translocation signal domain-containing protein [Opitutales bacterium]|nr:twin-arginine translocation signal domain-containing protein [Opitutales bacterium]